MSRTQSATIVDLVAERAAADGEQIAVACGQHRLTYARLVAEARGFAGALRANGVRRGDLVGVLADRGPGLVTTLLGVLSAGCGYVFLDRRFPDERLAVLVRVSGLGIVVDDAGRPPRIAGVRTVATTARGTPVSGPVSGADTAFLCFTSGSRGTPKPVALPHSAMVTRLAGQEEIFHLDRPDRVLQFLPLSWDVGNFDLWAPLAAGATLVLYDRAEFEFEALADAVLGHAVTHLQLPSALINAIAADRPELLRGLRQLVTGGDVASSRDLAAVRHACPALEIVNAYGPVEATFAATAYRLAAQEAEWSPRVPIGSPLHGTEVTILDEELRPASPGSAGQIYLGGPGLATGYLGMPGMTAERFVPHPSGGRVYRTGDLARVRPDGALEYLGRLDNQVKIRGHRVEPGEIEAAFAGRPGVRGVATRIWGDRSDRRVAAYLVLDDGTSVTTVRDAVAATLPHYLVPSWVVAVGELPRTVNGKLDQAALPDPRVDRAPPAPTGMHSQLGKIWAEVLGLAAVRPEDDFFALGGDSLTLAKVLSRIRERVHADVTINLLFGHPVLADLAIAVEALPRPRILRGT